MRTKGLSGTAIKLIAAVLMVADHVAFFLIDPIGQPAVWIVLRLFGRIAFPLFAYMIAEGCRYTRHPWRYFRNLFVIGGISAAVTFLAGEYELNVMLTFAMSILTVFSLWEMKKAYFDGGRRLLWTSATVLLIAAEAVLSHLVVVDYNFIGIMTPVFVALFDFHGIENVPERLRALDNKTTRIVSLCVPMAALCVDNYVRAADYTEIVGEALIGWVSLMQIACFAAVPILCFYNGERGRHPMKWFFYLFYPLHVALIYGIVFLLYA